MTRDRWQCHECRSWHNWYDDDCDCQEEESEPGGPCSDLPDCEPDQEDR